MSDLKRCRDVYPLLGWPAPPNNYTLDDHCCMTCHEDEEYGYDMLWVDLPDKTDAYVCCVVAREVNNLPL
jgi:hypothetical protein